MPHGEIKMAIEFIDNNEFTPRPKKGKSNHAYDEIYSKAKERAILTKPQPVTLRVKDLIASLPQKEAKAGDTPEKIANRVKDSLFSAMNNRLKDTKKNPGDLERFTVERPDLNENLEHVQIRFTLKEAPEPKSKAATKK
jgi:hypothetical protein